MAGRDSRHTERRATKNGRRVLEEFVDVQEPLGPGVLGRARGEPPDGMLRPGQRLVQRVAEEIALAPRRLHDLEGRGFGKPPGQCLASQIRLAGVTG
jgi:hypothetical protein